MEWADSHIPLAEEYKIVMVHYSNQCHLLLLHLVDKASNWGLEDPNVIFFSPICSAPASGMASHATKLRCLSLWKHQPFQLCYPLLSSFAVCWGSTASELLIEPKMMKWHWTFRQGCAQSHRASSFPSTRFQMCHAAVHGTWGATSGRQAADGQTAGIEMETGKRRSISGSCT